MLAPVLMLKFVNREGRVQHKGASGVYASLGNSCIPHPDELLLGLSKEESDREHSVLSSVILAVQSLHYSQ
jgi:hypothetical protein